MRFSVAYHDNLLYAEPEPIQIQRVTDHGPTMMPVKPYYRLYIGDLLIYIEPERARILRDALTAQLEQEPDQAVCAHGKGPGTLCDKCEVLAVMRRAEGRQA